MKHVYVFLLLTSLLELVTVSCSTPTDKNVLDYEQSLIRADSLVRSDSADSACAVRLLSDLHHRYTRVKELSEGKHIRLVPAAGWEHFFWGTFGCFVLGLNVWFSIRDIRFSGERKHRCYLIDLSENEQRLRGDKRERAELEECPGEMSLTDEEREGVQCSLTNLMDHGSRLCEENKQLRTRLEECKNRSVPRELGLMMEESEHARQLDGQVQVFAVTLVDGDEVVEQLCSYPKFLTNAQWEYLQQLMDRIYKDVSHHLVLQFPQFTPADNQFCLLIRLGFSNAQIATFTAVSSSSVSQQKFHLKKRMIQTEEGLFAEEKMLKMIVGNIPTKSR